MATTFNVISLGVQTLIDPTEGNTTAENASSLVGLTFGDVRDPLWENVQSFSPGTNSYGRGTNDAYDMNNNAASENFRINGGPNQVFDGTAIYNATITYTDGTTARITAVIFQDTNGNTYLAPEFSANSDQTALQAKPIQSLRLNSLEGTNYSGLTASRQTTNFMVCFAEGTLIRTPDGDRAVETLSVGDMVTTLDSGAQPVRWIKGRMVPAIGDMRPVRIAPDAMGRGLPARPLWVSRQHRMMVRTPVAARMFGQCEVLIPAHKLCSLTGVDIENSMGFVTYWHFMCDAHEIVFANEAPAETLYLGQEARKSILPEALDEVLHVFPDLRSDAQPPARPFAKGAMIDRFAQRLAKNGKKPVEQTA
ncbi:Hint domain-containing protein [Sulfitobacter sp. 20_GPM-1509m]|uniref:Hint domain-containing protein n=1 Tax=Sulfitobacter sp. 20_GPM-1509m TaxID=1380367 RepID=UPI000685D35D|nr:Hint domain-containing protein [Sulfitobacter sp. 20_GPM-1509m]